MNQQPLTPMSTAAQDFKNEAKPISQFEMELSQLLNKHSMENSSDTPDYVLAEYLSRCLYAYNNAIQMRKIHSGEIEREKGEREDGEKVCGKCDMLGDAAPCDECYRKKYYPK